MLLLVQPLSTSAMPKYVTRKLANEYFCTESRESACLVWGVMDPLSVKGIKGDVDKSPTTTGFRGRAVRLVAFWCKD